MQENLPPLLFSIPLNLPTSAHLLTHTHTKHTQHFHDTQPVWSAETTWTKRSGFTLLEELEPLGVETEENYNI